VCGGRELDCALVWRLEGRSWPRVKMMGILLEGHEMRKFICTLVGECKTRERSAFLVAIYP